MIYAALLSRIDAKASGKGWDARCPLANRHKNGDRNPSVRLWMGGRGELVARCMGCGATWEELVRGYGTSSRDWWPNANPMGTRRFIVGKVTGRYDYFDEDGHYLAQKVRREPGPNNEPKHFSWRRPVPEATRKARNIPATASVWGLEAGWYEPKDARLIDWRPVKGTPTGQAINLPKVSPGLYRLPQMLATDFEKPIFYVEGERKADLLCSLKFMCVSGPGGAGKWQPDWAEHFRDRRVVIFPDNNVAGLQHASAVAGSLVLHGAAAVKVILPGEGWPVPDGEDIGDWLLKRSVLDRRDEVVNLLKNFAAYMAVPCSASA